MEVGLQHLGQDARGPRGVVHAQRARGVLRAQPGLELGVEPRGTSPPKRRALTLRLARDGDEAAEGHHHLGRQHPADEGPAHALQPRPRGTSGIGRRGEGAGHDVVEDVHEHRLEEAALAAEGRVDVAPRPPASAMISSSDVASNSFARNAFRAAFKSAS